jgi:hypothetical protein
MPVAELERLWRRLDRLWVVVYLGEHGDKPATDVRRSPRG